MIGLLPTPYPGELVHGIVARYARQFATDEQRERLVGLRWLGIEAATQFGLCSAVRIARMGAYADPDAAVDRLLHKHTLLPYSLLFYAAATRQTLLKSLSDDPSHHAESLAEQLQVPYGARKLSFGLRYCPSCAEEDERDVGEPYWHLEHQSAGTSRCERHDRWLWVGPVIRRRLVTGPKELQADVCRPMGHGKPKSVVRRIAEIDQLLRNTKWHERFAKDTRRALLSALRRRRGGSHAGAVSFPDGWREFGSTEWERDRETLWNAGIVGVAALGPHRLTRDIWRLTHDDRQVSCYLGQLTRLEIDVESLVKLEVSHAAQGPRETALFKDLEVCGSRFCSGYDAKHERRLLRRQAAFGECILGSCSICGWQAVTNGGRTLVREYGSAFKREAMRLAYRTLLTNSEQASALGISEKALSLAWSKWQRSGETVEGNKFGYRRPPARRRRATEEAATDRRGSLVTDTEVWKLRPGLHYLDPQYDAQAAEWLGADVPRYERILAASDVLTKSDVAARLRCTLNSVLARVFKGRLLALRRGKLLYLPSAQLDAKHARVRPGYLALFRLAVAKRVNPWDLAEQLVSPVSGDPKGRTLHQLVLANETAAVEKVVARLAPRIPDASERAQSSEGRRKKRKPAGRRS